MLDRRMTYMTWECQANLASKVCHCLMLPRGKEDAEKWCVINWKYGKQVGIHSRLKANPSSLTLTSILLSNIHSLDNEQYTPADYSSFSCVNSGTAAFLFLQKPGSLTTFSAIAIQLAVLVGLIAHCTDWMEALPIKWWSVYTTGMVHCQFNL